MRSQRIVTLNDGLPNTPTLDPLTYVSEGITARCRQHRR